MGSNTPHAAPSPPPDDALHITTCSVCGSKQRLGARYCDMCGKRLSITRINDHHSEPSPSSHSSSSPSPHQPAAPSLSKRLWDRPLPSLASSRSSLRALHTVQSFLSSLLSVESSYVGAVTKLTCAMSTEGMQSGVCEGWSFFVQYFIDRVRGRWRLVKRLERALQAIGDAVKASEALTQRMEKDVHEQQKALKKESDYLQRQQHKHIKRASQSSPPSTPSTPSLSSNPSFSRWKLGSSTTITDPGAAEDERKNASAAATEQPKSTKLQTALLNERKARAVHNAVVTAALNQLEQLEREKVELMLAIMSGLMGELSHDHMKGYQAALGVKDKVDGVDSSREVVEWARHLESGVPCTWMVSGAAEPRSPFAALLRALRDEKDGSQPASGNGSGDTTPHSLSRSLSPPLKDQNRPEVSVVIPGPVAPTRAISVSVSRSGSTGPAAVPVASVSPNPASDSSSAADGYAERQRRPSQSRPSPRVMSDSRHQLVVQPSRMLRLDHIATPKLTSSDHAVDYPPWLPPHSALQGYHVEPRQWEMAAFEALLLSPSFLTPSPQGPPVFPVPESPSAIALEVLRQRHGLPPTDLEELVAALYCPYQEKGSSGPLLNRLLSSVNYRLLLLRTVDEGAFSSLKAYSLFFQRQCHVVLASLLWETVNASGGAADSAGAVKEWHHHHKAYTPDKMQAKIVERIKALADVYCDAGNDDYAARRRERCDAVSVLLDEIAKDERGEGATKKDSVLQRIIRRRDPKKDSDDHSTDTVVPYPRQVRYNTYRELVQACVVKASATPPPSARNAGEEREVEERMAVLHPRFAPLLTALGEWAKQSGLSPLFTSMAVVHALLDLVNDQSVVQESAPLVVPALRSSDVVLARLEEEVEGLAEKISAVEQAEDEHRDDEDGSLTHFSHAALQHFDAQLSAYLSDYHQSSPVLLQRVCSLYSAVLQLLHPPSTSSSSELERVFLREKKVVRILQRSVTCEFGRLRSAFSGRLEPRHWAQLAGEVGRMAQRERDDFHKALMPITHTSLDITLPTLSTVFHTELNAALAEHPSADPFFLGVIGSLTSLHAALTDLSRSLTDPYLLTSTLPALESLIPEHVRRFVSLQVTHVQQWEASHVGNDSWVAVDDALNCSASVVDALGLLFATVDTFFAALAPLLPHSLSVLPFFLNALNECVSHYSTLVRASCGDEAAVRPKSMATTKPMFAASVLTRARSIIAGDETPRSVQALSHQSVESLCVRLCNLSVFKDRLPTLQAHVVEQWEAMKRDLRDPGLMEDVLRCERELGLTASEQPSVDDPHPAHLLANASDHLSQCQQAVLSLLASRVVYVDWNTPLLTVLYQPLPSSPAVNFRESGFMELLDSTMVGLFQGVREANFPGVCEWVYRYLMQALEWTLVGRERPKGTGLLEAGVIGAGDVALLEEDWKEMRELFVDDLGEERMRGLGQSYEALLQKLTYRAQSNATSPKTNAPSK